MNETFRILHFRYGSDRDRDRDRDFRRRRRPLRPRYKVETAFNVKQWYNSSPHVQEDVGEEEDYSAYEDGWQHEDDYFR